MRSSPRVRWYYRLSLLLVPVVCGLGFVPILTFDWGREGFGVLAYAFAWTIASGAVILNGLVASIVAARSRTPPPTAKWAAGVLFLLALAGALSILLDRGISLRSERPATELFEDGAPGHALSGTERRERLAESRPQGAPVAASDARS